MRIRLIRSIVWAAALLTLVPLFGNEPAGNRRAFLLGIERYEKAPLKYIGRDINEFHEVLQLRVNPPFDCVTIKDAGDIRSDDKSKDRYKRSIERRLI